MSSVASAVVVLLSVVVIVYRLRVKLYTKFKFHPFDRDECLGEDMGYDVFLSCSSDDNLPHGNKIRELLEERGYRACYPPRDFVAGDTIYDNIYNSVVRSKRTVCLLTEHFRQRLIPLDLSLRCGVDLFLFIINLLDLYFTLFIYYTVSQKKLSRFVFVRTSSNFHQFR